MSLKFIFTKTLKKECDFLQNLHKIKVPKNLMFLFYFTNQNKFTLKKGKRGRRGRGEERGCNNWKFYLYESEDKACK